MNSTPSRIRAAAMLSILGFARAASAQLGTSTLLLNQDSTADAPVAESTPVEITFSADPRLTLRADVRDSDSDVLVSNNGFDARIAWTANPDLRIVFGVGGEVSFYDWGGSNAVFPGASDSFEDVYTANFLVVGRQTVSGRWAAILGGLGRVQGESGANFGDSLTAGGFVAAGYNFSESSWIDFGIGVFTRLEDDPLVIPYFNLRLPINDRVRFEVSGLDAAIVAAVSDTVEVALKGRIEYRDFRLDDSRPAWSNGVVTDLRVPIGVELALMPAPGLTLAIEGGVTVYQEFEFLDSDGDHLSDVETEPAPYIGLRFEYIF
jgi:hypothetical protein